MTAHDPLAHGIPGWFFILAWAFVALVVVFVASSGTRDARVRRLQRYWLGRGSMHVVRSGGLSAVPREVRGLVAHNLSVDMARSRRVLRAEMYRATESMAVGAGGGGGTSPKPRAEGRCVGGGCSHPATHAVLICCGAQQITGVQVCDHHLAELGTTALVALALAPSGAGGDAGTERSGGGR